MRKFSMSMLFLLASVSATAATRDKHQSFISFDDGGSSIRQQDGRLVESRVNVPVFPGDAIETGRRGRVEVRLADKNVVALDRGSILEFQSIEDSYDGDSSRTVATLSRGQVIVHRPGSRGNALRLDTDHASYLSGGETIYSIESNSRSSDVLSVFSGSVEVRTPDDVTRVRAGEAVSVDRDGVSSLNSLVRDGTTDFERWYLRRVNRPSQRSRYLDPSLSYADSTLSEHGSWFYAGQYNGWVWRPYARASNWRPYHYGRWNHSPGGQLIWVSDEPWGWVPYHYGRWALSSAYGWVWLPGTGYSPAWVYWMYGPSYVGWIPSGFYDCYRPYSNWLYSRDRSASAGFGFNGRIRLSGSDLNGWTFLNPDSLISRRVDQAALATDSIRGRLTRDGDRALISNSPLRLNRSDLKDPSSAISVIARRGLGGGTGKDGSGNTPDMTSFIRRDPELSSVIKDRIVRSAPVQGTNPAGSLPSADPGRGAIVDRGGIQRGVTPSTPVVTPSDRIPRGDVRSPVSGVETPAAVITERPAEWRSRIIDRSNGDAVETGPVERMPEQRGVAPVETWRGSDSSRVRREPRVDSGDGDASVDSDPDEVASSRRTNRPAPREETSPGAPPDRTPRQIIDRIGGARVTPSERPRRETRPARESEPRETPRREEPPRAERQQPAPRQEAPRSEPPREAPRTNIKRDQDQR